MLLNLDITEQKEINKGEHDMTVLQIKKYLKDNNITYIELSNKSGIPIGTLKSIFSGRTPTPRIDTVQAIENALGLSETETAGPAINGITDSEKRLLKAFNSLIPPMQDYVLETTEKLASQPQNVAKRA